MGLLRDGLVWGVPCVVYPSKVRPGRSLHWLLGTIVRPVELSVNPSGFLRTSAPRWVAAKLKSGMGAPPLIDNVGV